MKAKTSWFRILWLAAALVALGLYYTWHLTANLVGIVETRVHRIGPREGGLVRRLAVEVGARVREGQVLAQLDTSDLRTEQGQLQEQLSSPAIGLRTIAALLFALAGISGPLAQPADSAEDTARPLSLFLKAEALGLDGNMEEAIAACDKQRGSLANVLRSGIERYKQVSETETNSEKRLAETQTAIEEANALEVPLLERNLIVLSTIASIATMVGLLGTTIGMIRAFAATGHRVGGVIDAQQLAVGISEALVNTAGGLWNAIIGIVAYNFFVNKVDAFNYTMDEATYEVIQLLKSRESEKVAAN